MSGSSHSAQNTALAVRARTNAEDIRLIIKQGQIIQPTVELVEFMEAVAEALDTGPGATKLDAAAEPHMNDHRLKPVVSDYGSSRSGQPSADYLLRKAQTAEGVATSVGSVPTNPEPVSSLGATSLSLCLSQRTLVRLKAADLPIREGDFKRKRLSYIQNIPQEAHTR